jgi:hypothetical protein
MSALTAGIAGLFIGAFLGVVFMAMLSLNRADRADLQDDDDDGPCRYVACPYNRDY